MSLDGNDCPARRHGTLLAYEKAGCRCPDTVAAMRAKWRRDAARRARPRTRCRSLRRDVDVDMVAVERATGGDWVPLNLGERRAATSVLDRRGWSASRVAEQLGVSLRTVQRYRAELRRAAA